MKRLLVTAAGLVLCAIVARPLNAAAASALAALSGPGTVRAGDTITVVFSLNSADGLIGASGEVRYDASRLTLSGTAKKIGGDWTVTFNNSAGVVKFVANDATQGSPIKKKTDLFEMKFKVNNADVGAKVEIRSQNVEASAGSLIGVGDTGYSATMAAPLSANCSLAALTASNAALSPAFSKETVRYTAEVPFSVSKLDIQAAAEDGKAKVSIQSPTLTPGGTTRAAVTVTAENGAKKTYAIDVTRAQDPDYVASGNNDLASITVDGFLLSPGFRADMTRYVIWLPYETERVTVSGKAADGKAGVEVVGGEALEAGADNPVRIVCTAENGEKKEYTVVVKRAAAHDEQGVQPTASEPEASVTPATKPVPAVAEKDGVAPVTVAVTGILCLLVGALAGFVIRDRLRKLS